MPCIWRFLRFVYRDNNRTQVIILLLNLIRLTDNRPLDY